MRTLYTTLLAAGIGLASWAVPVGAGLFSATGKIIAIVDGELFLGEAEGQLNGTGTLAIYSQRDPALTCLGKFASNAALEGAGQMLCSDGATATFRFKRLSVLRGYGAGTSSRGSMSFVYGLSAEEAALYLKFPAGKKLTPSGTALELVDL